MIPNDLRQDKLAKRNREQATFPKLGYGFCACCDRALVSVGSKCPICKTPQGSKRRKRK